MTSGCIQVVHTVRVLKIIQCNMGFQKNKGFYVNSLSKRTKKEVLLIFYGSTPVSLPDPVCTWSQLSLVDEISRVLKQGGLDSGASLHLLLV